MTDAPPRPPYPYLDGPALPRVAGAMLYDADGTVSAADLDALTGHYAALVTERVPPGGRVVVCAPRNRHLVAAALGCLLAGRVYVPLDPAHPPERLRAMLDDAAPHLVLTDDTSPVVVRGAAPEVVLGGPAELVHRPDHEILPRDPAYLIYTSGSTGRPKGVTADHGGLAALVAALRGGDPAIGERDVVLSVASVAFDMSITDIVVPLLVGASVVLPADRDLRDPDALLDLVDRHAVTTVLATPSLWRMLVLAGLGTQGRRRIRAVGGGERLTEELATDLLGRTEALYNGYGPTESTVYATMGRIVDPADVPLGHPLAGTDLHVLDDDLRPVEPGADGELHLAGPQVCPGYRGLPRQTASAFLPDPFSGVPGARMYRTGDVVRLRTDGQLDFVGRTDFQVKVRGHRVEPGEVEAALERHPGTRQATVLADTDARRGTVLTGYVVPIPGSVVTAAELIAHARTLVPPPMVPARIVLLPALPVTVNGKVDRVALREWNAAPAPVSGAESGSTENLTPGTEAQRTIAELWSSVLDREVASAEANFFELGGHSLLAMEVVARLRSDQGVDLPVWELFTEPTVRVWAEVLERSATTAPGVPRELTARPLSVSQRAVLAAAADGTASPAAVAVHLRLDGPVDAGRVVDALVATARCQPALRVALRADGQTVEDQVDIDLDELDLRDLDAAARDDELAEAVADVLSRPVDPVADAPVRALLAQVSDTRCELVLLAHDALLDDPSRRLLVDAFAEAYDRTVSGTPVSGAPEIVTPEEPSSLALAEVLIEYRGVTDGDAAELPPSDVELGPTLVTPVAVPPDALASARTTAAAGGVSLRSVLTAAMLLALEPYRAGPGTVGGHGETSRTTVLAHAVDPRAADPVGGSAATGIGPLAFATLAGVSRRAGDGMDRLAASVQEATDLAERRAVPAQLALSCLEPSDVAGAVPAAALLLRTPLPGPRALADGVRLSAHELESGIGPVGGTAGPPSLVPVALDLWPDGDGLAGVLQLHRHGPVDDPAAMLCRMLEGLREAVTPVGR